MKIKFLCESSIRGAIPSPVPAIKAAPEYYKKIKPQIGDHPNDSTVKRCIPFMDAMSSGFIIPLWADVFIRASGGNITLDFPIGWPSKYQLGSHSPDQIPNHPLSNKKYGNITLKWVNPWVIETEPGVSCLFTGPLNHLDPRFKVLDGVVDTDTYYTQVHFPFLWQGGDGDFFIPRGTPLVQVIPFRREEVSMSVEVMDEEKEKISMLKLMSKMKDRYKTDFWHKGKEKNLKDVISNNDANTDGGSQTDKSQVVGGESGSPQMDLQTDAKLLHQNGYVVLLDLITQADAEQLTAKLREYIEQTHAQPDPLCPKSQAVHGMPASDELLEMLTPAISKASGKNLIPTYSYARMYVNGETLPKHTDRPACQYSVTLCLGMDGDPWPIFMSKTEKEAGGSVSLNVGDGVLYLGMDMHHWREPFEGQWQAQVFLHWVDADGPHADQKYDGRLALSHHNQSHAQVDDNAIPLSTPSATPSGILEVSADDAGRGFGEGSF
jgi:hypothetical protein